MSKSAFSIKAFAFYLVPTGLSLLLVPNLTLSIFQLPETQEVWIRVVGVLLINIGIYYWFAAVHEASKFFHASIYTRTFVFIVFILLVIFGLAKFPFAIIGFIDFTGAVWTYFAIKKDRTLTSVSQ